MEAFTEGSLLAFLATVPDPRSRHGRRHPLSAILSLGDRQVEIYPGLSFPTSVI